MINSMKNFFKKIEMRFLLLAGMLLSGPGVKVFGQDISLSDTLDKTNSLVSQNVTRVLTLVQYLLGFGFVIGLAYTLYHRFVKQDNQANDKIITMVVLLFFAVLMLQLVKTLFFRT